jgi:hypothetical protein
VGTVGVAFTLRTSNHLNTSGAATVDYATVAGTATPGDDYAATSSTFVIPANTPDGSTVTLNLPGLLLNDGVGEPAETFSLSFTNPSAGLVLSRSSHAVTITNDGDPVGVSVQDLVVTEGNATTHAAVVVRLAYPADTAVSVDYSTSPWARAARRSPSPSWATPARIRAGPSWSISRT